MQGKPKTQELWDWGVLCKHHPNLCWSTPVLPGDHWPYQIDLFTWGLKMNSPSSLVTHIELLKHCYQQEFACKHTKILLVDILVPVFRPHFTVCNPLSNINIWHVCIGSADGLHLVQCTDTLWKNRDPVNAIKRGTWVAVARPNILWKNRDSVNADKKRTWAQ